MDHLGRKQRHQRAVTWVKDIGVTLGPPSESAPAVTPLIFEEETQHHQNPAWLFAFPRKPRPGGVSAGPSWDVSSNDSIEAVRGSLPLSKGRCPASPLPHRIPSLYLPNQRKQIVIRLVPAMKSRAGPVVSFHLDRLGRATQ